MSVFHWCCSPAIRCNVFIGLRQAQPDIETFPLLSGLFNIVCATPKSPKGDFAFPS